jgi:hypothetical protein
MHPRPPSLRRHEHPCACSRAHARRALASLAHACVRTRAHLAARGTHPPSQPAPLSAACRTAPDAVLT